MLLVAGFPHSPLANSMFLCPSYQIFLSWTQRMEEPYLTDSHILHSLIAKQRSLNKHLPVTQSVFGLALSSKVLFTTPWFPLYAKLQLIVLRGCTDFFPYSAPRECFPPCRWATSFQHEKMRFLTHSPSMQVTQHQVTWSLISLSFKTWNTLNQHIFPC